MVNARAAHTQHDVPPTEVTKLDNRAPDASNFATRFVKMLSPRAAPAAKPAGSVTIGRASDNDIVVPDVLASRYHATLILTPLGTEIRDTSVNGTFVNGTRVGSAILSEGDVVTVGNIDLVVSSGLLVRRSETEAATRTGGLEVRNVQYVVENGKQLLSDISLTARPGTLTAVIGGSGAGKSTLARLIAGYTTPSSGSVTFEGHDIHAEYASLRSRIGMVPQDDVVHRQLTVNQALSYAAELRLPPDTSKADRTKVVSQVLEELDLTKHANTRVDKLSGGQRKRASVALELLTGPSLLMLDEPTSGLDPALDLQVMTMLRQLADAGRVVLVVTHSLSYLDVCDQVLLVAPGGKTAYCGPPDGIGEVMGTTNWAKIFSQVGADPDEANRRFREREEPQPPSKSDQPADLGEPVHTSVPRQISTIARRQVRLVVADRAYFVFLALLPFILGALSLTVPGTTGFRPAGPHTGTPDESAQILALLLPAAAFMGVALTIRDLVGERAIFQREQAVGLSTTAYLLAKTLVFCGFAILQAAIVTAIVVAGKGAPSQRSGAAGPFDGGSHRGAVHHRRRDLRRVGRSGPGHLVAGPVQRADYAVVRGRGDGPTGAVRRDGSGDRPTWSGPVVVADARALGVRGGVVDCRRPASGAAHAASPRPVLAAHPAFLAARHGHARRADGVLCLLCPLEDPASPLIRGMPFTRPSTRRSICAAAPTPIPRGSCGPWMTTPCGRGASTWPAPRPAARSSTTSNRGCCHHWGCGRRSSTSTPATNATMTTTSTSASTRPARTSGGQKTSTSISKFAAASGWL